MPAYRKPHELKISKKQAKERGINLDDATRWIEALDRIHKTRRIQRYFDRPPRLLCRLARPAPIPRCLTGSSRILASMTRSRAAK